jgi:DNA-binding LytR/AlgR family response regulator
VCFLDVQMPGLSGVQAAQQIGRRAHLVFVTAFEQYAVQAFEQGVLDYLVKPVESDRLADTVARLQERLQAAQPAIHSDALLQQLAQHLQSPVSRAPAAPPLRWIRAAVGQALRLIPVAQVDYLRADHKYTVVAWRNDQGQPSEAVISTPLKDLLDQLDGDQFAQVHRSVVVNLAAVSHVVRGPNETADLHLKGRPELLRVSRSYLHLFRQM